MKFGVAELPGQTSSLERVLGVRIESHVLVLELHEFAVICPRSTPDRGGRDPNNPLRPPNPSGKRQYMLTSPRAGPYPENVDIEPSARKHGVSEDDTLHALQNHWRAQ